MKDAYLHSFIKNERQRFISYVRSLPRETAAADAEDLVHDVLLKVLEKADLIVSADNLAAYVYRALKNRVIDYIRTRKTTLSLDGGADEENSGLIDMLKDMKPNALEILQSREGNQKLFRALELLSAMEKKSLLPMSSKGSPLENWRKSGMSRKTPCCHINPGQ